MRDLFALWAGVLLHVIFITMVRSESKRRRSARAISKLVHDLGERTEDLVSEVRVQGAMLAKALGETEEIPNAEWETGSPYRDAPPSPNAPPPFFKEEAAHTRVVPCPVCKGIDTYFEACPDALPTPGGAMLSLAGLGCIYFPSPHTHLHCRYCKTTFAVAGIGLPKKA